MPHDKEQVYDGEWYRPIKRGFKEICCDCSLVHITDYRLVDGELEIRSTVDRRATAARRRKNKNRARRK